MPTVGGAAAAALPMQSSAASGTVVATSDGKGVATTPTQKLVVNTKIGDVNALDDGFNWRKYGQKFVRGNPHPKSYYRCTAPGCSVKKSVERKGDMAVMTYDGTHNHPAPITTTKRTLK